MYNYHQIRFSLDSLFVSLSLTIRPQQLALLIGPLNGIQRPQKTDECVCFAGRPTLLCLFIRINKGA